MEKEINVHNSEFLKGNINQLYLQSVRNNSIKQIQWCLEQNADKNYESDMALDTATSFNCFEALKYLVEHVGLEPANNFRCILQAAKNNNLDMLYYLVEKCNCPIDTQENRPIKNAVLGDSLECFLYLRDKGVDMKEAEIIKTRVNGKNQREYKTHLLSQLAWNQDSGSCLQELLQCHSKEFFTKTHIKRELNARSIVLKLDNQKSLIATTMIKALLNYKPEYLEIIKESAHDLGKEDTQTFNTFINWCILEHQIPQKKDKTIKRKI